MEHCMENALNAVFGLMEQRNETVDECGCPLLYAAQKKYCEIVKNQKQDWDDWTLPEDLRASNWGPGYDAPDTDVLNESTATAIAPEEVEDASDYKDLLNESTSTAIEYEVLVKRGIRPTFTGKQMFFMERLWEQTQNPDLLMREEFASQFQVPESSVKTWFENRRARFAQKQEKAAASNASSNGEEGAGAGSDEVAAVLNESTTTAIAPEEVEEPSEEKDELNESTVTALEPEIEEDWAWDFSDLDALKKKANENDDGLIDLTKPEYNYDDVPEADDDEDAWNFNAWNPQSWPADYDPYYNEEVGNDIIEYLRKNKHVLKNVPSKFHWKNPATWPDHYDYKNMGIKDYGYIVIDYLWTKKREAREKLPEMKRQNTVEEETVIESSEKTKIEHEEGNDIEIVYQGELKEQQIEVSDDSDDDDEDSDDEVEDESDDDSDDDSDSDCSEDSTQSEEGTDVSSDEEDEEAKEEDKEDDFDKVEDVNESTSTAVEPEEEKQEEKEENQSVKQQSGEQEPQGINRWIQKMSNLSNLSVAEQSKVLREMAAEMAGSWF